MEAVPLKIQTRFSPLLSAIEPEALAARLRAAGFGAAGIADRGVLFGAAAAAGGFRENGVLLAAGAEVVIRFPRPGGDSAPSSYVLTFFPETEEGRRNLDLLLEKIARPERPACLQGVAELREVEACAAGLLALTGGLAGPVSGAFARGRAGDAHRAVRRLVDLFGPSRLFLETSRTGAPREGLVEPFLREIADRYRLRRVAADPVLVFRTGEDSLLARLRAAAGPARVEGPPDAFLAEAEVSLRPAEEMAARYDGDPEPLRAAREVAERTAAFPPAAGWTPRPVETDELLRMVLVEIERRYAGASHGKRKEIETRFFEEFWALEGRLRAAVLPLARVFRAVRRARPDLLVHTRFLSGSAVGWLTGLQTDEPDEMGSALPSREGSACSLVIEGDREGIALVRRLLGERFPGFLIPPFVPRPLDPAVIERAIGAVSRRSREGSGPDPHPPTANPSGPRDRGTRSPDPLSRAEGEAVLTGAVAGYDRDPRALLWTEETGEIWADPAARGGPLRFDLAESPLLGVLRATSSIEGEGDPFEGIRRGEWTGILERGAALARDLVAAIAPRTEEDLALLLAAGIGPGPRRDLVLRIAEIRAGTGPPTVSLPRLAPILRETAGVPFYQEQIAAIIRNLTGCARASAHALLRDLRSRRGPRLARDRSLFVRRSADRGVAPEVAGKVFSLLLAVAPHAPSRGAALPLARRVLLAAGRKSIDRLRFAAAALNDAIDNRKRMGALRAGFEREGIAFLPLDQERSAFEFCVEGEGIRVGLAALSGVARGYGERIVAERKRGGSFKGDADLLRRLADLRLPRAVLEEAARAFRCAGEVPAPAAEPSVVEREGARRPDSEKFAGRADGRPKARRTRRRRAGDQTAFSFLAGGEPSRTKGKSARSSPRNRGKT